METPAPTPGRHPSFIVSLLVGVLLASSVYPAPAGLPAETATPFTAPQVMRYRSGLTVLVAPYPTMPTFTATLHYRAGSALDPHDAPGAADLASWLLGDGTTLVGTRDRSKEVVLLRQLDRLDGPLTRKLWALPRTTGTTRSILQAEITRLSEEYDRLFRAQEALRLPDIYRQLYRERGGTGPHIRVGPTQIQYSVTLPANQLSFFLAMEADRMKNGSTRGFYAARGALARSRAEEQSGPGTGGLPALAGIAFQRHPFGRYPADPAEIRRLTRQKIREFNARHLRPAQMILSLAGGVRPADVRALAGKYFEGMDPGPPLTVLEAVEPPQLGLRRLNLPSYGPGELMLGFHLAAAGIRSGNPVMPVLIELLNGQEGPLMPLLLKGRATQGQARRFPPAGPLGTVSPGLLTIEVRAAFGTRTELLEQELLSALDAFSSQPPSQAGLDGARSRVRARMTSDLAHPASYAPMLAEAFATMEDEEALFTLFDALDNVTPALIQATARRLMVRANLSIVARRPGKEGQGARAPSESAAGSGVTGRVPPAGPEAHPRETSATKPLLPGEKR